MNAFLTLTGLETLPLRMRQHNKNAETVANFLNQHEKIAQVSWAGLSSSPYYSLAKQYLQHGAGSVFTVSLKGGYEAGIQLVENCNLISHLANIGDTRTLIVHPASTTHRQLTIDQREAAGVGDSIVRLSIGIEHADDIIADLDGALKNIN
jgi:O-acetylhomoserine (thiol)-lyase